MAVTPSVARVCSLVCRRSYQLQILPRVSALANAQQRRAISATTPRLRIDREEKEDKEDEDEVPELKSLHKAYDDLLTPDGLRQLDELAKLNGHESIDQFLERAFDKFPGLASEDRAIAEQLTKDDAGPRVSTSSFWYDEEDPYTNTEELDEFDENDITSMAHGKLDEVREVRHMQRLAVWEMPLLSKYAKPFEPPTKKQVLRWRYTTYMGESHPAENKVVVEFSPDDLGLSKVQAEKLKKLVGARYNPEKELIKMSCENYEYQAQNKAYLLNLVNDLIKAAKDPKDTFADIPLDVRHYYAKGRGKPKVRFPKEWRMTTERQNKLDQSRESIAIADVQRAEKGLLIDGQKSIDSYLMRKAAEEQEKQRVADAAAALRVSAGRGGSAAKARR